LIGLRKKSPGYFVMPREARNLSFFSSAQPSERFLASLGMTKQFFPQLFDASVKCGKRDLVFDLSGT
jgi:hypothetical protein